MICDVSPGHGLFTVRGDELYNNRCLQNRVTRRRYRCCKKFKCSVEKRSCKNKVIPHACIHGIYYSRSRDSSLPRDNEHLKMFLVPLKRLCVQIMFRRLATLFLLKNRVFPSLVDDFLSMPFVVVIIIFFSTENAINITINGLYKKCANRHLKHNSPSNHPTHTFTMIYTDRRDTFFRATFIFSVYVIFKLDITTLPHKHRWIIIVIDGRIQYEFRPF